MKLTDEERAEYEAKIDDIVRVVTTDGDEARTLFTSADVLAREMLPEEPANIRVINAMKGAHLVFNVSELKTAMTRAFRAMEDKARHARAEAMRKDVLHIDPANEREYIAAFMASRGYDMDYHRKFFLIGSDEKIDVEDIANDARLTAGDLDLIKPRGKVLAVAEIGVALAEWANLRRAERKQIVADRVATLSPDRDKDDIDGRFSAVCEAYFEEPAFAEAACRKFIWSCKRRLIGEKIKHVHMLTLVGPQDTGKTAFSEMLYGPLGELATVVSLPDLLDTRQMDMPTYYAAFCDELAFAENARPAQLKTFLNGGTPSRRPMRTNISQKIEINVTVLATANHSLDKLIYDSTGMRRFVEIRPKPRAEIEPYWEAIEAFDWLGLWQSIDPVAEDPLVSKFKSELMAKQENIRNLDNAELWLNGFDPRDGYDYRKQNTSSPEKIEWYAEDLYKHCFRVWEEEYDPGYRGTHLQRWGKDMRSLIANGKAEGWSHRVVSNRTVYGVTLTSTPGNQVVPIIPKRTFR